MIERVGTILACVLLATGLLPGTSPAQTGCKPPDGITLVSPGILTATTSPTVPPLQYIDESGNIVGMDMDLGNLIGAKLCLPVKYVASEFVTMIPALKTGRYDMIDTFMYYTPERAEQVHMIPYGAATNSIVVAAGAKYGATMDDFSGKRLATQLGSMDDRNARTVDQALKDAGKLGIEIHTFPSYADVLQALAAGQVDGAIVSTDSAYYYKSKGATFFSIAASGLYPHLETISFADPVLAQKAADALNELKADGSYDKLLAAFHHCALPGSFKVSTGELSVPVCAPRAD